MNHLNSWNNVFCLVFFLQKPPQELEVGQCNRTYLLVFNNFLIFYFLSGNWSSLSECSEGLVLLLFNPLWPGSYFSGDFSLKHLTRSRWTPTMCVTTSPSTTSGRRQIQIMTGNWKNTKICWGFEACTDPSYSTSYIEQCNEDEKYCQVRLALSAQDP